ncbi:MAG: ZIP family metal transporter [Solirubrobacterales bacterium]
MPELLVLLLAACGTTLATGLGAVPVFVLGAAGEKLVPALLGLAAGVMSVAAVLGLLLPAAEGGSTVELLAGCAIGVAFLVVLGRHIDSEAGFMSRSGKSARTSGLLFLVLFVHSPRDLRAGPPSPPNARDSASGWASESGESEDRDDACNGVW